MVVSVATISTFVVLSFILLLLPLRHSVQAEEQTQQHRQLIAAVPLFVRVVGPNFDPRKDDVYFISAVQILFDDYYQTYYSDTLNGFDIAVVFLYEETSYESQTASSMNISSNESTGNSTITSWCEIQTTFSIPIENFDASRFTSDIATQFVMNFFSINEKSSTKLRNRLFRKKNLTIITMEAFATSSDIVQTELHDFANKYSDNLTSSKSNNPLKVLAGISGTIIGVAAIALLLSTYKRRRDATKNDQGLGIRKLDGTRVSATANNADETASDVENESREDQRADPDVKTASKYPDEMYSDMENENDDHYCSSYHNDDQSNTTVTNDKVSKSNKDDPPIVSSESFCIDDDADEDADGDDDDDETVVTRNQVSPTVSHYTTTISPSTTTNGGSSGSSSPVWSIFSGNSSSVDHTTSPYSSEENVAKRYRWHESDYDDDDIDVTTLLSLPEEPSSPRDTSSYASSKQEVINVSDVDDKICS